MFERIDFTAPADGTFVLKLHDQLFRGGPEFFYRLTLGRGPRIDFIFPPAGVPGARSQFIVYGRGLPGGAPASGFTIEGKVLEQIEVNIEMPENSFALQRLSINSSVKPSE